MLSQLFKAVFLFLLSWCCTLAAYAGELDDKVIVGDSMIGNEMSLNKFQVPAGEGAVKFVDSAILNAELDQNNREKSQLNGDAVLNQVDNLILDAERLSTYQLSPAVSE